MRNDIFIDNNIAKNFNTPLDPEYIRLIEWLRTRNERPEQDAVLMISQKLVVEYNRSNIGGSAATNILTLVNRLTREGRITKVTNQQIKDFKNKHFTKTLEGQLRCNHEDREHIPVVMLSDRKYALAIDANFCHDLINFPRFNAKVAQRPQDLPYREDWSNR